MKATPHSLLLHCIHPFAGIFYRLRLHAKFIVLGTAVMLPMVALSTLYIPTLSSRISALERQLLGIEYIHAIHDVLVQAARHRSLLLAQPGDAPALEKQRRIQTGIHVDDALAALLALDARSGLAAGLSTEIESLSKHWRAVKDSLSPAESLVVAEAYSDMLVDLARLFHVAAHHSGLTPSGNVGVDCLVEALTGRVPAAIGILNRAAGLAMVAWGLTPWPQERYLRMQISVDRLSDLAPECGVGQEPGVENAFPVIDDFDSAYREALNTFDRALHMALNEADQASPTGLSKAAFYEQLSTGMDEMSALLGRASATVEEVLKARLVHTRASRSVAVVMVGLVLVLQFLLLTGLYLTLRQTISNLALGAARLASGNLDYRVTVPARDETQSLADSFNRMAEAIASLFQQSNEARKEVERLAFYDSLTGLLNRTGFHRAVDPLVPRAKTTEEMAVLVLDVSRFGEINLGMGYHTGDALLQELGRRLNEAAPKEAVSGRLGASAFAVAIPRIRDEAAALALAQQLMAQLQQPFRLHDVDIEVRFNIGLAIYPQHGSTVEDLVMHADAARLAAKNARGGCVLYGPEHQVDPGRLVLLTDLRHAIESDELVLVYQPKVHLQSGLLIGSEALVRWPHPRRGLLPPVEFIPLAEQTGLITSLTMWVIDAALRQLGEWDTLEMRLSVAVNISTRDLHNPNLPSLIAGILARHQLDADRLTLEVTESSVLDSTSNVIDTLAEIHRLGVRIAIDDFGTGYSSLAHLRRLDPDELKIDRSFVMNMLTDRDDALIVRSTIRLAHDLGLVVTAEGIENVETMTALKDMGCDVGQGFGIARPLAADKFLGWINEASS